VAVIGYILVATFPGSYVPIMPGLDPSWAYGLNVLPQTEFLIGRDVVFTSGPLGYLISPLDIGANLVQAAWLWIATQLLVAAVGLYHYLRHRRLEALAAFAVAYLVAMSFGIPFDYRLLLILGLLLSVPPRDGTAWRVFSALAGLLGGFLLFTKSIVGFGALLMLAVATVVWLLRRDARIRDLLVTPWGSYAAVVLTVAATLMDGIPNFIHWVGGLVESARGYSVSMSAEQPTVLIVLGVGAFLVYLAGVEVFRRLDGSMFAVGALFVGGAVAAFKHSYVRHGGRFLFAFLLGAVAIVLLTASSRRLVLIGSAAFIVLVPLAAIASVHEGCICPWRAGGLGPTKGWENLRTLAELPSARRRLGAASEENLVPFHLPPEWLAQIGGGTVDVIPSELSLIEADRLRWVPNPVLQTYTAFTPDLDRRTARHFRRDDAPDFLLVQFVEIDGRHPMWGAPLLWRAILSNYEPAPVMQQDWIALLRRRATPQPLELTPIGRADVRMGEWIDIPSDGRLVFGRITLRETLPGILSALLLQVEPLEVDLRFQDGSVASFRLLPLTAPNGVLLTPSPELLTDFLALYKGRASRFGAALRLGGPGSSSYHPQVEIVWEAARWPPRRSADRTSR
jgi:hypothetical protein